MLTKKITYKNYNDEEVTDTLYFNLTEAELMEMQLTTEGGYKERLESVVETRDTKKIYETFKGILLAAYGEKTPDGRFLDKGEDQSLAKRFTHTEAYNKLMMELMTDEKAAAAFFTGIMPKDMREKALKEELIQDHKAPQK